ncbi:VOC family protein [Streptomyces albipurpureus]|uniref:VOC family protein n=1 Tax=Streptomyces albipurpureus TaxID=2897419 RepID=A0ABT0UQ69_9ACTN|nr:VOC family protein [Streptomyces sp. CWNU-1]MCM2390599.1 VOC family protein [Streptomyces sp. CWNU-1]
MTSAPRFTLASIVIDCHDAQALAAFYAQLLGWRTRSSEPGWVHLRSPDGTLGLSLQSEADYQPPYWPEEPGAQQKMLHPDIQVDDLEAATRHAVSLGATEAAWQPPGGDLTVLLDPAGHPFCLFLHR